MAYDLQIGTMTVFMEANNTDESRLAIAYSEVNRLKAGHWGKTLAAVCVSPHQYSSWNYAGPNLERLANVSDIDPVLAACEQAVSNAIHGTAPDPTGGATYYFRYDIPKPPWSVHLTFLKRIGDHEFYK
jgi:hypothetical protein